MAGAKSTRILLITILAIIAVLCAVCVLISRANVPSDGVAPDSIHQPVSNEEFRDRFTPQIPAEDAELMGQCIIWSTMFMKGIPGDVKPDPSIIAAVLYLKLCEDKDD